MKYLTLALGFFFLAPTAFAASIDITPLPVPSDTEPVTMTVTGTRTDYPSCQGGAGLYYEIYAPSGAKVKTCDNGSFTAQTWEAGSGLAYEIGTWHAVLCNVNGFGDACSDLSYPVVLSQPKYAGEDYSFEMAAVDPPPPAIDPSLAAVISNADASFASTTGVSLNSVLTWMAGVILLFIGMGLALLNAMKVWIVAVIAIGVIIFFVFKGLRFFGASK